MCDEDVLLDDAVSWPSFSMVSSCCINLSSLEMSKILLNAVLLTKKCTVPQWSNFSLARVEETRRPDKRDQRATQTAKQERGRQGEADKRREEE